MKVLMLRPEGAGLGFYGWVLGIAEAEAAQLKRRSLGCAAELAGLPCKADAWPIAQHTHIHTLGGEWEGRVWPGCVGGWWLGSVPRAHRRGARLAPLHLVCWWLVEPP